MNDLQDASLSHLEYLCGTARTNLVHVLRRVSAELALVADSVEAGGPPPSTPIQHDACSINSLCGEYGALREMLGMFKPLRQA